MQEDLEDAQLKWVYGYINRIEMDLLGESDNQLTFRYEVNFRRAQFRANGEIRSL